MEKAETITHMICDKCSKNYHIYHISNCQMCDNYNLCHSCVKPFNKFSFVYYGFVVCRSCKKKILKINDFVYKLGCDLFKTNMERQHSLFEEYKNILRNEINK